MSDSSLFDARFKGHKWRSESPPGSVGWHAQATFSRRLRVGIHIYRHRGGLPDRWVFQPFLVFDRKWRDA